MREEALSGGNMNPVVRIGSTVRRVSGEWTEAVHELLRCYESAEIPETPRPRGVDREGREILTFIEGETLDQAEPGTRWKLSMLREAGALMRRLHDAAGEPLATRDRTWRSESHAPVEVICHNDFAPYNLIVREGRLVGVIDFDMASPGPRLWDFAYLAYRLVPYAEDAVGFDPALHGSREDRLQELIEAYGGGFDFAAVRIAAARRLDDLAAFTERHAATTGRQELTEHAAMYRRDAERCRSHGRLQRLREWTTGRDFRFRSSIAPGRASVDQRQRSGRIFKHLYGFGVSFGQPQTRCPSPYPNGRAGPPGPGKGIRRSQQVTRSDPVRCTDHGFNRHPSHQH